MNSKNIYTVQHQLSENLKYLFKGKAEPTNYKVIAA